MKVRLHARFQSAFHHGLGNAIRYGGHPEQPLPALLLGDRDHLDGRREVAPRGQAIPEFVEVIFQLLCKRCERFPITTGCPVISFHLWVGFPHGVFGNTKRLR